MNRVVQDVTQRIIERSMESRTKYLKNLEAARVDGPYRHKLPCSNLAHAMAVCHGSESKAMKGDR